MSRYHQSHQSPHQHYVAMHRAREPETQRQGIERTLSAEPARTIREARLAEMTSDFIQAVTSALRSELEETNNDSRILAIVQALNPNYERYDKRHVSVLRRQLGIPSWDKR